MTTDNLINRLPTNSAKVIAPRSFLSEVPTRKTTSIKFSPLHKKEKKVAQLKQQATFESYAAFKEIPSIVMMSYFAGDQISLMSLLQLLQVLKTSIFGLLNSYFFLEKYKELEIDIWPIYFLYFVGYTTLSGFVYWKGGKMGLFDWDDEWIALKEIPQRMFNEFVV
mgnify:FL=1